MKLSIKKGTTSKRLAIFIQDSSQTDGRGLTGLVWNTSGLAWHYWREDAGDVDGTQVTLCAGTRGTYTNSGGAGTGGGFIAKDGTNMPGFYEISIPDAALAAAAGWVVIVLRGAPNMAPLTLEIELIDNTTANVYDIVTHATYGNSAIKTQVAAIETDTQDLQAQMGVAGVGLTNLGDARIANLDATISSRTKPADTQAAVTTVTNLTNAPTAGDFTADMKTSLDAATPASVVGAVGSVVGHTPQTGDSFARLGAPAGASVSADVAAVKSDSAAILADTGTDGVVVAPGSKTDYALTAAYDPAKTAAQAGNAMALTAAERNGTADAILARTLGSEGYAADGAVPTLAQMLFMIWSGLVEFSISGTTLTCKKLDGSTTAMTFTLDDATSPTSRTRAT